MNAVLEELAKLHPHTRFLQVEAENVPELSVEYEIIAVPTFVFFKVRLNFRGAHSPAREGCRPCEWCQRRHDYPESGEPRYE